MSSTKLFITGATGLLGRSVLHKLSTKYNITALKREVSNIEGLPGTVSWVNGDLQEIDKIDQHIKHCDVVIHLAAKVNFNPKRAEETLQFNIGTTREMVNACLIHQKRLIHISSVAALGGLVDEQITENSPFDLDGINTTYARSKYFSEIEVWRGVAEGLEAVILNPSIILGIPSAFPESSGIFWQQVQNGLPRYPTGTTGFVDARDVAEVVAKLVDSDISGEGYIVSAENWSYKSFYEEIASQLKKRPPQHPLTKWQSNLLWRFSSIARVIGVKAPFNRALHQNTRATIKYDSSKVKKSLHMNFRPVSESIQWVSEAYLKSLK